MALSNLTVRILSAAFMLVVGLSALTWHPISRWALLTAILSLGAWEFARMVDSHFAAPKRPAMAPFAGVWVALLAATTFPADAWALSPEGALLLPGDPGLWLWAWIAVGGMLYTLAAFRWQPIESLAPWLFMSLFGLLYMGPWALCIHQLFLPHAGWSGIAPLLTAYVGIALADTGAYATGRLFGKRKLCPQISAKKTVEGAIGGTVIGALACAGLAMWLLSWEIGHALVLGLVVSLSAMVGDLFISVLKRYTGTKDASQIIPGHGGMLDRFDSLVFTGPLAALMLHLLGH
jgi:phosphatidate cytidylyltransferase